MCRPPNILIPLLCTALSSACFITANVECSTIDDIPCDAGFECMNFECFRSCVSVIDCDANEICEGDLCQKYSQSCEADVQCISGWHCANGACLRDLVVGNICERHRDCASDLCIDGVCCSTRCDGECERCDAGKVGECALSQNGSDPRNECDGAASCNGEGACFGGELGDACNGGPQCLSGFCADGICCAAPCGGECEACGGDGACLPIQSGLDPDDECVGALACNGQKSCYSGGPGASCESDFECGSGYCVDGVCCNVPCDDECQRCSAGGICQPVASADDGGTCDITGAGCSADLCSCNSAGECRAGVAEACARDEDCISGVCGGGVCCEDSTCVAGCFSCNSEHTGGAPGACLEVQVSAGDPLGVCEGASCDGMGTCFSAELAEACSIAGECLSGHCVDGVCCEDRCDGECRRCDGEPASAEAGTCHVIVEGEDPEGECDGLNVCGVNGECFFDFGSSCEQNDDCSSNRCCGNSCSRGWVSFFDENVPIKFVTAKSKNEMFAFPSGGGAWRYNFGAWTNYSSNLMEVTGQPILDADWSDFAGLWALDRNGKIVSWFDGLWSVPSLPTSEPYRIVTVDSSSDKVLLLRMDSSVFGINPDSGETIFPPQASVSVDILHRVGADDWRKLTVPMYFGQARLYNSAHGSAFFAPPSFLHGAYFVSGNPEFVWKGHGGPGNDYANYKVRIVSTQNGLNATFEEIGVATEPLTPNIFEILPVIEVGADIQLKSIVDVDTCTKIGVTYFDGKILID